LDAIPEALVGVSVVLLFGIPSTAKKKSAWLSRDKEDAPRNDARGRTNSGATIGHLHTGNFSGKGSLLYLARLLR